MNRKYKGSMLLEALVGLMILMIASTMVMTATIAANKSRFKREISEKLNRVAHCIINEIKYNYSYEEIKDEMLKHSGGVETLGFMEFKYSEDILNKLTTTNLFDLDKGSGIKIENNKEVTNEKIVEMKVTIKMEAGSGEVFVERIFNKSWWM